MRINSIQDLSDNKNTIQAASYDNIQSIHSISKLNRSINMYCFNRRSIRKPYKQCLRSRSSYSYLGLYDRIFLQRMSYE